MNLVKNMRKEKIKNALKVLFKGTIGGLALGIVGTAAILLVLIFIMSLQNTIEIMIEPTIENISLFNATITLLLVLVTMVYVYYTHHIAKGSEEVIKQSEIERNIAFAERRLEKFYYPLHSYLTGIRPSVPSDTRFDVYNWQYLAFSKTRELYVHHLDSTNHKLEEVASRIDLVNAVNSDIETLLDKLKQLTKQD